MQPMPHQVMGYDRAITMFSPDGRLLQVEYAKKTVRLGNTAIGIVCKDGVVLVTDKRIVDKLVVTETVEKIFQIDDHIISTASGILSDARVLVERAQNKAQENRVTYDSPIDILTVVKDMCSLKQMCTQSGGLRPFGVSLLVAGIDEDNAKLFLTDPTGLYYQYKATVIGEGETEVAEELHKHYKENMTVEQGLKLAGTAIKKFLDGKNETFDINRIDAAYVDAETKTMKKFSPQEIAKIVQ
ncbi:archaeal proteasome endopeptidase complex subunit alpha [Candidatus Woesearchaeota archaeon]|nr:archaeal proteasome endopeptidase complex subunit alpha [Candidatus Woesearchaeota archaeon]